MPKKSMVLLTETMFYVLMSFRKGALCGTEIADHIEEITEGRVRIGPATLYTILGKFESEKYIREIQVEGRKRTYEITALGEEAYQAELRRLRVCISDAEKAEETASGKAMG